MKKIKAKFNFKLGTKINLIVLSIILLLSVVVGIVVVREVTAGIKSFAVQKAKGDLSLGNRYIKSKYKGDWSIQDGKLYKGSTEFNENYEIVDKIGDDTEDTVTIFLGDTRVTTNVMKDGKRAIGTKVSPEVAKTVLKDGKNYYGEAVVAGNMYQTAYMPIKDSNGEAIGILYVGAPQKIINETIASFLKVFIIVLIVVIIISCLVVFLFTRKLKKRLNNISDALINAGNGDFTTEVIDETGDELSDLTNSFNAMKENLSTMIQKVMETSEQVAASSEELTASSEQTSKAAEQITEAIQQVANGSDRQTVSLEESSKALEEVTLGINNIAENSSLVAEAGAQTSERAKQGEAYVEETVKQINTIHSSVNESGEVIKLLDNRSKQIGEITKVITDIANQTNLLALNAAIEAARAGEHGKGFAVVADEVRKLAEQSQQSSTQITELIVDIQKDMVRSNDSMNRVKKDVLEGLGIVEKTQVSFKEILVEMNKMGAQIDDMAATAEQMSASAEQVSASTNGITSISRDTSIHSQSVASSSDEQLASMEEISASAISLSQMAVDLQELVSRFKVK
jgi:methyl-accepting chemotaxis protein